MGGQELLILGVFGLFGALGAKAQYDRGGNMILGFVVGLVLGPIGVLVAMYSGGRQCEACRSRGIPRGATKCAKCGSVVPTVAVLLTTVLLTGCVSMSPAGERVRVVRNANLVKDCAPLGEITELSGFGGLLLADVGYENNQRSMRNEVAQRGGDTLLLYGERLGPIAASQTQGEAFRCQ